MTKQQALEAQISLLQLRISVIEAQIQFLVDVALHDSTYDPIEWVQKLLGLRKELKELQKDLQDALLLFAEVFGGEPGTTTTSSTTEDPSATTTSTTSLEPEPQDTTTTSSTTAAPATTTSTTSHMEC
jgi:hypothetical protein